MKKHTLDRRTLLKGAGVAIALPFLEIMGTSTAWAQAAKSRFFFFMYFPNGTYGTGWDGPYTMTDPFDPVGTGTSYQLPQILSPLQEYKSQITLFRGLQNSVVMQNRLPNPHAEGSGGILTSHRLVINPADGIKNGISVDQRIASLVGSTTRHRSIVIANTDSGTTAGGDAPFWNNSSWSSQSQPTPTVRNPQTLFDNLFSAGSTQPSTDVEAQKRRFYKKSILDAAKESISRLNSTLGQADRMKMDEHLTSIRAIEAKLAMEGSTTAPPMTCNGGTRPTSTFIQEGDNSRWIDTMVDLSVMALRCNLTRVIVLQMDQEGSHRNMSYTGATGAHHDISHHIEGNKQADLIRVNQYYVARFKRALDLLSGKGTTNENLLPQGIAWFGTPFSNGNYHNHYNVPVVLAGGANGNFNPGQGLNFQSTRPPLANLHLSILRTFGTATDFPSFGNSTGVIPGLLTGA